MSGRMFNVDASLLLADGTRWPVAGPLSVDSEVERIYSLSASMPDEKWEHTDSHGHVHRYVRDEEDVPRLPSLKIQQGEEYWCEDCHDFHSDPDWVCRECGDVVKPGFKPDYEAQGSGLPVSVTKTYTVTVEANPQAELYEGASYVYTDDTGTEHSFPLPPLARGNRTARGGVNGWKYTAELHGWVQQAIQRKPVGP